LQTPLQAGGDEISVGQLTRYYRHLRHFMSFFHGKVSLFIPRRVLAKMQTGAERWIGGP